MKNQTFTQNYLQNYNAAFTKHSLYKEESLLIIDQNKEVLLFLVENLKKEYEIFTAINGTEGLQMASEFIPDLIIIAVNLSEKSGYQIASALKHDHRTAHLPLILISANGTEDQKIIGMKQMADCFMTIPFNLLLLRESIKNLLWNRQLLKNKFSSELPSEAESTGMNRIDKKFMNDFNSFIEQNLDNDQLHVEDIARALGISRIQLYRKTRLLLNTTINDYILCRRLKKAKHLLANEELPISEITYRTGFSSPAYFSAVFKSKYNCTPSDFKKNKQNN